jgi:hypothetical protein
MSSIIMPSRRFFLGGLIAAPAVIAANRLMSVKSIITADEISLAVGKSDWVLISNGGEPVWGKRDLLEKMYYEKNIEHYVNKTITPPDFKTQILKEVQLPERSNYRTVHAGTELLAIHPGRIIA